MRQQALCLNDNHWYTIEDISDRYVSDRYVFISRQELIGSSLMKSASLKTHKHRLIFVEFQIAFDLDSEDVRAAFRRNQIHGYTGDS